MKETSVQVIQEKLKAQRAFFSEQKTKSVKFRLQQLKAFKSIIKKNEQIIADALFKDLHKSFEESYLTEISIVLQEIDLHIKHLQKWAKPKKVTSPIQLQPSKSRIFYEPLGVSLIIAPWNYPFQLLMNPLVGAISAGNCVVLKPSPYTKNIALLMEELIAETFSNNYITLVQGGKETNQALLSERFDMIFFTGSPFVGKVVMKAAAEHLTPVVLELGGKSPCIVNKDANLDIAAKRIVWGKTINAGQTCIAPDYLFVHQEVKDQLMERMIFHLEKMFGKNYHESNYYPRIVNAKAFDRLASLLKEGKIVYGGETQKDDLFISPTIIEEVNMNDEIMQQEIFGPILPVLTFSEISEVIEYMNQNEKPLAFYYFGKKSKAKQVLKQTTSGGGCINDTIMHIVNHKLPFGGVGNSGMGKYHGKESFLAFSNQRSIVLTPTWIDLPMKYVPFKYFNWIRKIV